MYFFTFASFFAAYVFFLACRLLCFEFVIPFSSSSFSFFYFERLVLFIFFCLFCSAACVLPEKKRILYATEDNANCTTCAQIAFQNTTSSSSHTHTYWAGGTMWGQTTLHSSHHNLAEVLRKNASTVCAHRNYYFADNFTHIREWT